MRIWRRVPLLRLLICFVAGILLQIFYPLRLEFLVFLFCFFFLSALLFVLVRRFYRNYKLRWVYGLLVKFIFFFVGNIITWINSDTNLKNHFSKYNDVSGYIIMLDDQLHEKEKSFKTKAVVKSIKTNTGEWKNVNGNLLIYFSKSGRSKSLKYGDLLYFKSIPVSIASPANPGEFDYRQFLSFHNIFQQAYVPDEKWCHLKQGEGYWIISAAYNFREKMLRIFKQHIKHKQEFAVASALVLGYEDAIDGELINAYASAGALHVLSVSGMHVGIIFLALNWMLRWMNKKNLTRHLKHIILIAFIWAYAMLTGFSPSVLRSAAMLTFIVIGTWSKRNSDMGNSIVVSAFFLLAINPYMITEVGFQLSYLAILGIFYVHPHIFRLVEAPNWFLHKAWEITSVSISAQLMTFPLGLLYFHQFPNLFFISNLVVIPVATVVIYGCIGLLVFSAIPFITGFLSIINFWLLYFLNQSVIFVEKIPYSIISGISITILETWLIYFIIMMVFLFFLQKRTIYLQFLLVFSLIFSCLQLAEEVKLNHQKKFIVYNVKGKGVYDFISGREHFFLADAELKNNRSRMMFHIIHNWWDLDLQPFKSVDLNKPPDKFLWTSKHCIRFNDKKIKVVDRKITLGELNDSVIKLSVDYLILSNQQWQNIQTLVRVYSFKKIIIDSTYPEWKAARMAEQCHKMNIPCYSVPNSGAYVEDI